MWKLLIENSINSSRPHWVNQHQDPLVYVGACKEHECKRQDMPWHRPADAWQSKVHEVAKDWPYTFMRQFSTNWHTIFDTCVSPWQQFINWMNVCWSCSFDKLVNSDSWSNSKRRCSSCFGHTKRKWNSSPITTMSQELQKHWSLGVTGLEYIPVSMGDDGH